MDRWIGRIKALLRRRPGRTQPGLPVLATMAAAPGRSAKAQPGHAARIGEGCVARVPRGRELERPVGKAGGHLHDTGVY